MQIKNYVIVIEMSNQSQFYLNIDKIRFHRL